MGEENYKDGELISSKCWDEDGNECECSEKWGGEIVNRIQI